MTQSVLLDELFDKDIMEKAEYFCCYDPEYPDEPYAPDDTPKGAIENWLSEVGPFGYKIDETFTCVVCAFVDDGKEENIAIADELITLSLQIEKLSPAVQKEGV